MLERGARSIATIFRAIVFTFVPTACELAGEWPEGEMKQPRCRCQSEVEAAQLLPS